jgi:hypothetical protein
MKRFNHHSLALIPLLSILSMTPSSLMTHSPHTGRSIASVGEATAQTQLNKKQIKYQNSKKGRREALAKDTAAKAKINSMPSVIPEIKPEPISNDNLTEALSSLPEIVEGDIKSSVIPEIKHEPIQNDSLKEALNSLPEIKVDKKDYSSISEIKPESVSNDKLKDIVDSFPKIQSEEDIQKEDFNKGPHSISEIKHEPLPKVDLSPILDRMGRDIKVAKKESKHPRYDALVSKVDPKTVTKLIDIKIQQFKDKRDELKAALEKEKKGPTDKKKIEELVVDLLLLEGGLKDLKGKKGIEKSESEISAKFIAESKLEIEKLLNDLDPKEELLAKSEEKPEKKEEDKSDSDKQVCELKEKNNILTEQLEKLIGNQNKILESMMGLAQSMLALAQKSQGQGQAQPQQQVLQQPQQQFQYPVQYVYNYSQPAPQGNFVHYSQGFGPNQQTIFSQPQVSQPQVTQYVQNGQPQQQQQQQQPVGQPQQGWNMQPTLNLQAAPAPQFTPGNFGTNGVAFNMAPNPIVNHL